MRENSKVPCFMCVTQDVCRDRGECVQKDAWPSKPITCIHCGQIEKAHYHGETGVYCRGFYDSTKVFTPAAVQG